jgi:hypothetical protein
MGDLALGVGDETSLDWLQIYTTLKGDKAQYT